MDITKKQEKKLLFVGIILLAFAIFIAFIYLPARKRLEQVKKEYLAIQEEISGIRDSIGAGVPLEQAMVAFKNELDGFSKKFPEKEENILRELPVRAQGLGIEITSMRPDRKRQIVELGGAPIAIRGCAIQEMPIIINLRTAYKTLGEFLRILKEDLPVFMRVERVQMTKGNDKASPLLNVELLLSAYLMCPAEGGKR